MAILIICACLAGVTHASGCPNCGGGRGFDFDEDQSVIFFCDEVDFAAQGAKTAGENAIALLFYKFFCQLFAFGTGLLQAGALFAIKRA